MGSTTRTRLNTVVSAAVGAVAAVATIAIFPTPPSPRVDERAQTEAAPAVGASDVDRTRLERIEREIALLRGRAARDDTPRDEATDHRPSDEKDLAPRFDPDEAYAEQQIAKEDLLARHAREAVDTSWARDAEREIDLDLGRLRDQEWASHGPVDFELVHVSCRTHLCVVKVEWESARAAVDDGAYLAMHDYAQECTVTVFGPSPEEIDTGAPFLQEVVFDCA
jgi:hypothetical protein